MFMIGEVNFALDQMGYHDISSFLHLLLYGDTSRKTLLGWEQLIVPIGSTRTELEN